MAPGTLAATIITRPSTGEVAGLHDRAPVILPLGFIDEWLDAGAEGDQIIVDAAVAVAVSTSQLEHLEFYEVPKLTGDGPKLVEEASHS